VDNITGAIIGVLSALLTFVLTSWYQWLRDERDRKWRLEDMKLQRRLNVLNLRLADIQRYLNENYGIISSLYEMEYKLLSLGLKFKIDPVSNNLMEHHKNSNFSFASIFNLNDPDLTQLNVKLSQMIMNEENEYKALKQKISDGEIINKEQEEARINKFYSDASKLYCSMIKRVDELSGLN
jgi:hypothetical protein